jgi:hypothetical protein
MATQLQASNAAVGYVNTWNPTGIRTPVNASANWTRSVLSTAGTSAAVATSTGMLTMAAGTYQCQITAVVSATTVPVSYSVSASVGIGSTIGNSGTALGPPLVQSVYDVPTSILSPVFSGVASPTVVFTIVGQFVLYNPTSQVVYFNDLALQGSTGTYSVLAVFEAVAI